MMTIETKINGRLIGYCTILNKFEVRTGVYSYDVEYFKPNTDKSIFKFSVKHQQNEGAEKLALLVYKKLSKQLNK